MQATEVKSLPSKPFSDWLHKHLPGGMPVTVLALLTGVACALVSALLKWFVSTIQHFVIGLNTGTDLYLSYLITPVVGIFLCGLFVKYIVRDNISHGITRVLYAISRRKSRLKPHNTWTSVVASSITIGLGGSVGAEAPIVLTGAAIGSNIGRLFHMEHRNLMLLVGCGAAGAIAGIFKAPITGLLFVIEVLMMDFTLTSVMPLMISSVTAATVSYLIFGMGALFPVMAEEAFTLNRLPYVVLLGLCCGGLSLYFTHCSSWLERKLGGISTWSVRCVIASLILSSLIFLLPPLYGEGYDIISMLMSDHPERILEGSLLENVSDPSHRSFILFLLAAMLLKIFATVATNSGGGCGGTFAPTLFVGAFLGFFFSYICGELGIETYLPHQNFTLMGMAGLMAGVMHAPLTGTFLIAELSGQYNLFLPLLIVSLISYGFMRIFTKYNIYAMRLGEEGQLVTHEKDRAVLTLMDVEDVVEKKFKTLHPEETLGETVKTFTESQRNIFPVLDDDDHLVGIVMLDNIRNIMFRPDLYERLRVKKFMVEPGIRIKTNMQMEDVMTIFDDSGLWNLPVETPEGKYVGFISKSAILNVYRRVLNLNFGDE